ncbi:MAG: radical SAM family heme chaperone HemW [Clostridia bacterium]|nr:radical SAM family heme chaperone HemW [Clostridia bacterium]
MANAYNRAMRKNVGIYIHVPFCLSKCHYCDFCSVLHADEAKKERYVARLCEEIRLFADKIGESGEIPIAETVYFGGGTPTLLSPEQFEEILDTVKERFGIAENAEITVETNPKSADLNKLADIRKTGVNRLSIGMQSVHDSELRALGRIHGFADFKKTFDEAREAGFDNISVDLMYGIPKQTRESFQESIEKLARLAPEHISSYSLTVEEGTNFYRRRDSLDLPDEDTVSDMYADMGELLSKYGYRKYEISNFARQRRESRHNLKYWKCVDYLGFGVAAHSYFDGVRFAHSRDVDAYIEGKSIIIEVEEIGETEAMNEYALLGMRLADGVGFSDFYAKYGRDFLTAFPAFTKYAPRFVTVDDKGCRFTDEGMFVSNFILSDALSFAPET